MVYKLRKLNKEKNIKGGHKNGTSKIRKRKLKQSI